MGFTFELSKRKRCRASAVNLDMRERTAFQRQLQHSFALPSFNSRCLRTKRLKTATKDSENELEK